MFSSNYKVWSSENTKEEKTPKMGSFKSEPKVEISDYETYEQIEVVRIASFNSVNCYVCDFNVTEYCLKSSQAPVCKECIRKYLAKSAQ